MKPPAKRDCIFQPEFLADLRFWVKQDRRVALRIMDLVEAVLRDPFDGPGKPEALRFDLAGCWSRQKYASMAASVPSWITAINDVHFSGSASEMRFINFPSTISVTTSFR